MRTIYRTAGANAENQDRALFIDSTCGLVLVVADGAGGCSGGVAAAALAVEFVRQNQCELQTPEACANLLRNLDQLMSKDAVAGESTCALAVVTAQTIYGASVGDSGVWLIEPSQFNDLTQEQQRKPLLGTAAAQPVVFSKARPQAGWLLLATDGLLKYTSHEQIVATCRAHEPAEAGRRLIELVRYASGDLADDVTVLLQPL